MRRAIMCIAVCLSGGGFALADDRTVFAYHDAENRQGCFIHLRADDWVELTGNGDRFSF